MLMYVCTYVYMHVLVIVFSLFLLVTYAKNEGLVKIIGLLGSGRGLVVRVLDSTRSWVQSHT